MEQKKWPKVVKTLLTYMTLLFLALRACDVISWPWWCVLSPVIIPLVVYVAPSGIIGILEAGRRA